MEAQRANDLALLPRYLLGRHALMENIDPDLPDDNSALPCRAPEFSTLMAAPEPAQQLNEVIHEHKSASPAQNFSLVRLTETRVREI
jgi:hypothetical protein